VVSHSGYDNYEQGVLCAEALIEIAERMDTKLYAYELWCPMSVKVCSDRDAAFVATVAGHPLIEVVQGPPTEALDELALQAIEDAFPAQPELNCIVLMGGMMDGTTQALRNLGRLKPVGDPDHVVFVTINGPVLENIRQGYMDLCIGSPVWEMSDGATKLMLNYICLGKEVEKVYYMPIHTITTDNVDGMPFWVRWADVLDDNPDIETWPILDMAEVGYPEITMPTVK
jgi:ABC-type sugar transport system substrate-binding protein